MTLWRFVEAQTQELHFKCPAPAAETDDRKFTLTARQYMLQGLAGQNILIYTIIIGATSELQFMYFSLSPSACKSANIDLVFLIDGSKSVRPQNFELVKKFVNQVGHVCAHWFSFWPDFC